LTLLQYEKFFSRLRAPARRKLFLVQSLPNVILSEAKNLDVRARCFTLFSMTCLEGTVEKEVVMRQVDLPVWMLTGLALFSTITFSVYYYFDRYNHSDQTVIEHQLSNVEIAVRENPQNPNLRVAAADYYLESGLINQSIQQSHQALALDPKNQGALVLLARAYQKTGEINNALAYLQRVLDLNRDNPLAKIDPRLETVHYEMGTLFAKQERYAEAVASLKLALEINRADADAHYMLGTVYQKQNEHAHAVVEFREAIRFIPDFVEAYDKLAASANAQGDVTESAYARAMVLLWQGQFDQAAAQLEALTIHAPDLKRAYFGLGLAYEKLGKRDQAVQALREFVRAYPNDIAALQALGRVQRGN
jgi:tetratricopeptide (TPR) repeat protein